jgi:cell wall-associated NlpC family hydrolase
MKFNFVQRARALIGVPFRPQGRSPELGLDCVGLTIEVFGIAPTSIRRNYRLRGEHRSEVETAIAPLFRRVAERRPGDLMLLAVAADQLHLAISTDRGFVHADAGLRRVVETPADPRWPIIGIYRKRARRKG